MSAPDLFDPSIGPRSGWPEGASPERAYLQAFAQRPVGALIANLRTEVFGLCVGKRIFPVTVNAAEYGDAYVCLPHTAYALYAKEELRIVAAGALTPALSVLADGAGALMRAARLNAIAHVDNWMLSTNLHGDWRGEDVVAIREALSERFPDRLLGVRSLTRWADAALLGALEGDGWRLLPSRQVYVTDDVAADWAPRRDTRRDLRLHENSPYEEDDLANLREHDAARIAELYALLYLDRYSKLNPAFTADYIAITHAAGVFRYRGVRDAAGDLVAVVGCWRRGGVLTTPIVGYDTSRPASEGLYRICCVMLSRMAMEEGLKLNGSAGAASFKRHRGARPEIEYTAYYVRHLSPMRRAAVEALKLALDRVVMPIMVERGL